MSSVLKLSVPDRIKLISIIWNSISEFPDAIMLSDEQSKELDERLENYDNDPGGNVNWEEAKEMLLRKKLNIESY